MGINVAAAKSEANRLEKAASELHAIRTQLSSIANNLRSSWSATEMQYVNQAFNKVNADILKIETKLAQLRSAIISTANEIQQEEEEKERQRLAEQKREQERREKERLEREKVK